LVDEQRVIRTQKTRAPEHYMSKEALNVRKYADIDNKDMIFEFMLNALRLKEGVPASLLSERTGMALASMEPLWHDLRQRGLMVDRDDKLATTERGGLFLNDVLQEFLDYAPSA
jgi:oxygen-independent coproporphyrinogen-3 oxidase